MNKVRTNITIKCLLYNIFAFVYRIILRKTKIYLTNEFYS